jgi:hypothetical protein
MLGRRGTQDDAQVLGGMQVWLLLILRAVLGHTSAFFALPDTAELRRGPWDDPDPSDTSAVVRPQRRVACYQANLYRAGFALPANFQRPSRLRAR